MLTFPEMIAVYRRRASLSQTALAERLGWKQPRLSLLETGRQQPTAADVLVICTELQIPVADAMRAVGHAVGAA